MFEAHFDTVEQQRKAWTVYSSDPGTDIEERLATRNVSVTHRPLPPGGPGPYVTIRDDHETITAVSVGQLEQFLSPSEESLDSAAFGSGLNETIELFDETLFRSLDRRQLLFASREIEDRAFRVGRGTLRALCQTKQSFDAQEALYRRLATETDLDIHSYGTGGWTTPDIEGIEFHTDEDESLEPYWCLAFDGGPEPAQSCVLLAREDETGYDGFWSYDADLVAAIGSEFSAIE